MPPPSLDPGPLCVPSSIPQCDAPCSSFPCEARRSVAKEKEKARALLLRPPPSRPLHHLPLQRTLPHYRRQLFPESPRKTACKAKQTKAKQQKAKKVLGGARGDR